MAYFSFLLTAFILFPLAFATNAPPLPPFKRIYQFGNSISDTGNLLRLPGATMHYPAYRLPYGETFFHKATGRFSDGRLIVDFIAAALKLPFLDAYLDANGSFAQGVNFAVAGATALDVGFFAKRNISTSNSKPPISKQLEWFENHLKSTFQSPVSRSNCFENSLFIFGEFGGNDYFPFFRQGWSTEEVRTLVPHVVAAIIHGIKRIVELGAKRILVPGPFPFGCLPSQLASSNSSDPSDYDGLGCLKSFNAFSSYHNGFLRRALSILNREVSGEGVVIVYADYEGAFLEILRKSSLYGLDREWLHKACCGAIGKKYRYDYSEPCGTNGTDVCPSPAHAMHWDGVHLTDASYHRISQIIIRAAAMASSFVLTVFILFPLAIAAKSPPLPSFKSIYQFGDSLSDTGNLLRLPGGRMFYPADRLPYGETYFRKATGRFSDGRLIVDFIAAALNLPFVDAYLNANGSFAHGVNFAVAGATASDEDFFTERNISTSNFKPAISKQLEWFETHINNCTDSKKSFQEDSLFIFGEFGGNDYFPFFRQGWSIEEARALVPHVVATIIHGIKRIVRLGAKRILVPGPFPFGCLPSQLAASPSNASAFNGLGCVKAFNDFSSYHNRYLRRALSSLNRELSGEGVVIVYGDYEGAFLEILQKSSSYGFDKEWLHKACCGAGGNYHFDQTKPCGTNGTDVCPSPAHAMHWDGVHLTDASYHRISQIIIDQSISQLI
nr:acetylajmalan esterase-like [Ipomoea batatas]